MDLKDITYRFAFTDAREHTDKQNGIGEMQVKGSIWERGSFLDKRGPLGK